MGEAQDKDEHGRLLSACPEDKRSQYPASPLCCDIPMVLYFARPLTGAGGEVTMIGGYLLRCTKCASSLEVDLITSLIAGHWVREVL